MQKGCELTSVTQNPRPTQMRERFPRPLAEPQQERPAPQLPGSLPAYILAWGGCPSHSSVRAAWTSGRQPGSLAGLTVKATGRGSPRHAPMSSVNIRSPSPLTKKCMFLRHPHLPRLQERGPAAASVGPPCMQQVRELGWLGSCPCEPTPLGRDLGRCVRPGTGGPSAHGPPSPRHWLVTAERHGPPWPVT